jgi:hypothetical protein
MVELRDFTKLDGTFTSTKMWLSNGTFNVSNDDISVFKLSSNARLTQNKKITVVDNQMIYYETTL